MTEPNQQKYYASLLALVCTATQILFQMGISLGLPFGKAAYGGGSEEIPVSLRIISFVFTFVYMFFGSVILQASGMKQIGYSDKFCLRFLYVMVGFLYFECLLNLASSAWFERFVWSPFCFFYGTCCLVIQKAFRSAENRNEQVATEEDYLFSSLSD